MRIRKITDKFYISPQIDFADIARLADDGFRLIINNRPDGENPAQPLSAALAKAAKKAKIDYIHIPIKPGRIMADDKERFKQAFDNADGKVLGFCRSGMRSHSIYRAAMRSGQSGFLARLFGRG